MGLIEISDLKKVENKDVNVIDNFNALVFYKKVHYKNN